MTEKEQNDALLTAIINALSWVDEGIRAGMPDDWSKPACKAINHAVEYMLEMHESIAIAGEMVDLLQTLHAKAINERDEWKAKFESVAAMASEV